MRPYIIEFFGVPQAGKTTSIRAIKSQLENEGYKVHTIQESAELLPKNFPRKGKDSHIWMRLLTVQHIIEAKYSDYDVVIADRGVFDALFWDELNLDTNFYSEYEKESYDEFFKQFTSFIDYSFVLKVSIDEAIARKGREGTFVNRIFLRSFTDTLDYFIKTLPDNSFVLDTTNKTPQEVISCIMNKIQDLLQKDKQG